MAEGPRLTPTPSPTEAITTGVPSDRLWLRSELMGTQVITRDTGRRLGVVGEVIVDIDRREVVAVGLRDNPLTPFSARPAALDAAGQDSSGGRRDPGGFRRLPE